MSLWFWIVVAGGAPLALSIAAALVVAAILGNISREVSGMLEHERWGVAPIARGRLTAANLS
jgi:hypothetical protein